jgi:RNA polymerase sigma-70 factor (ECF subfamily)
MTKLILEETLESSRQPGLEPKGLEPTASDLVERVLAGDAAAYRALVESHEAPVFGLCRLLLSGNHADAEEATQETFLQAYRYLDRLADRNRFAPWLYQIARSLCRVRRRRRDAERRALGERAELERRQALPRDADLDGGGLAGALDDLPCDEREALELKYFDGLSYDAIARRLGRSFSQVDHLIRSARARLSRRFEVRRRREERP